MASPQNFASDELARILAEQASAIRGYTMEEKTATGLEASAAVQLLEGTNVVISLSARGYQYRGDDKIYESLEEALRAVSPKYIEAQHAELVGKLASLGNLQ